MKLNFKSVYEFNEFFKDEKSCFDYFEKLRWNCNPVCPHCHSKKHYVVKPRGKNKDIPSYRCANKKCDLPFSVRTDTIFEGSKIVLKKWFYAIYLLGASKKGISSIELSEQIGVSQKTAWLMCQKIREVLEEDDLNPLEGINEVDETFVGGKNKNRHADKKVKNSQGRSFKDKTPVIGLFNHDNETVRLKVIPTTSVKHITKFLVDNVKFNSTIFSDDWQGYNDVHMFYNHYQVDHSRGQYTNGDVTTNRIENFWSILKRGIIGVFHKVSRKHLQRYCNEFQTRFNFRKMERSSFFSYIIYSAIGKNITYVNLVKQA